MDGKIPQELPEVIQSSNLNFLLGAGISTPLLPLLNDIEKLLNGTDDATEKEKQYKKYLNEVMMPNKKVIRHELTGDDNFKKTKSTYEKFFLALEDLILKRKSTLLSKQVNLFTSNIDVLMEVLLEELQIEYNDGFSGRFNASYSLANYKKSIHQRSLHFEHVSEIPVFNVIKIHGSLTWKHDSSGERIVLSPLLDHMDDSLSSKSGADFISGYKKILVVNPEESKHLESVLNLYYSELLRMYSSELEKENATLFTVGFSMEDKHIKEITLRAAKSNPTLRVFVCCSRKSFAAMQTKLEVIQHPNIQILNPEDEGTKFTLDYFTENVLQKVVMKNRNDE